MTVFIWIVGVVMGLLVGYSTAKIQHHVFLARAWARMAQAPMGHDEKLGVVHSAEDVMRAFTE